MRIGIILHPYGEDKPGGLARVIFEWTKALVERDTENEYIIFLKDDPKKKPDLPGGRWTYESLGGGRFWLDNLRDKLRCDVYIFNTPVLPLRFRPEKSIIIAYDFPYKHLPAQSLREYFQYKITGLYHKWSLKRANAIISVSDSTKREVVELFGIRPEKITTIYHGFKRIGQEPETKVDLPARFFFFAVTIKERKNVFNIIRGFEIFKKLQKDTPVKVVIAGKKIGPYYEKIVRYITENGLTNDVVFLDHVNDSQLSYIYKKAEALVFPSLIEGTGNPILEAMDCGVPVITSNIFGPAELGGSGSALLIDPYKPEEIGKAMLDVVGNRDLRNRLIKNGFEQVKKFSWDTAFQQTIELVKKVMNEGSMPEKIQ